MPNQDLVHLGKTRIVQANHGIKSIKHHNILHLQMKRNGNRYCKYKPNAYILLLWVSNVNT